MSTITSLSRTFVARYGAPAIQHVDLTIFRKRYFTHCLSCGFCADSCCSYGVDVDLLHVDKWRDHADAIEAYTGVAPDRWFQGEVIEDEEMPGGGAVRTGVEGGACVFLDRRDRGCTIHKFCDDVGYDYHDFKSIVDCLFPLVVSDQTLCPADEVDDGTLACVNQGPTLYRGLRGELEYYFGAECVEVLDDLEEGVGSGE